MSACAPPGNSAFCLFSIRPPGAKGHSRSPKGDFHIWLKAGGNRLPAMTIWRATVEWTGPAGGPAYTTLHLSTSAASQEEEDAVVDVVQEFVQAAASSMRSGVQGVLLPDLIIVDEATGKTGSIRAVDTIPYESQSSSNAIPSAANAMVKIRCGNSSASIPVRGRVYIPWPSSSAMGTDGLPTAFQLGNWRNYVAQMQVSDPLVDFGVWSQKNLQFLPAANIAAYPDWAYLTSRRD